MECGEIKNKYPQMEIIINSREAEIILMDLQEIRDIKELMPETKQLRKYLLKLSND